MGRCLKADGKETGIYVMAPPDTVSPSVRENLKNIGTVKEIGDNDPIQNAIAFARYYDARTGFGNLLFQEHRFSIRDYLLRFY